MSNHHIHPEPAVRALVERAKAEERERIAQAIEAVRSPSLSATENGHLEHAARIARADSLAAQPAPEHEHTDRWPCACGLTYEEWKGAQPAPEAATVEEGRGE